MSINKEHLRHTLKFDSLQAGLDFSWGRKLEGLQWLKSFKVVDVGDIQVPVSQDDLTQLLRVSCQVPPGDGLRTAVRHVWQIDESQISASHPEFFSVAIPELAVRATRQLGLDSAALEVEAKASHILIYPSGGFYRRFRNHGAKEKGAFATMLLQIPVEGGHKGGEIKVWLRRQMKTFDTATESSHRFHLLTFYDDCEHELKPVSEGCRLVMIFHLVAKKPIEISSSILDRSVTIEAFENIRKVLSPWQEAENEEKFDVLAIPLDHIYEKDNLLFSCLKGKDRLLARMFQSMDFVETHLAIVTKHVTGSPNFSHEDYQHLRSYFLQNVKKEPQDDSKPVNHSNSKTDDEVEKQPIIDGVKSDEETAASKEDREIDFDFVMELLGYLNYIEKHFGSVETQIPKMISEKEPVYTTDNWISKDDRPASFRNLNIRTSSLNGHESELVADEKEIFEYNRPDDELMSLSADPPEASLEFRYYRSFLVVWPQRRSFNIICRSGIDNALKHLERSVKQRTSLVKEEAQANLRRLLWHCRKFPAEVWAVSKHQKKAAVTGQRSNRLLGLCVDLGAKEESIELLNILGTVYEKGCFFTPNEEPVNIFEGIQTDQVAAGIAALVAMLGWAAAEEAVTKLVSAPQKCKWLQIGPSAVLSTKLLDYQCTDAAFTVGNLLSALLADVDLNAVASANFPALASYAVMVIRLEESRQTSNPTRLFATLEKLKLLEMRFLVRLVVELFQSAGDQIRQRSSCRYLYTVLCQTLVDKIDLSDRAIACHLAEVTQCYFWLEDPSLLRSFVDKICRAVKTAVGGTILDQVMCSLGIWKMNESTLIYESMGQLIDARIEELSRMERPEFTWKQPEAQFKDHPDVEGFFHSDKPRMIYARFSSVVKARKFAADYFTPPTLHKGFSATIRIGGKGENAYCEIIKTRDVFDASLHKFFAYQQELKKLKSHRLLTAPVSTAVVVAGKRTKNNSESQASNTKRVRRS